MKGFTVRRIFVFSIIIIGLISQPLYGKRVGDERPHRVVKGRELTSTDFPSLRLRVDKSFRYLGKFSFTVANMSSGERYIFAQVQGRRVRKLFIVQFEAILPDSSETYNYSFADALTIGGHKFKQNTFAFDAREALKKSPPDEGALTTRFLRKKGFVTENEIMAARLVNVPDAERKHEMILFYMENVSDTGHALKDFYSGEDRTPFWRETAQGLAQRLIESFTIIR
jgi:hypothetical protein